MSVTHSSYTFGGSSLTHGDVVEVPWELKLQVETWFGVNGESHLTGEHSGRDLVLPCCLFDFNTWALITEKIDEIDSKAGRLTGTLTVVSASGTRTLPYCTFIAFQRGSPIPGQPWATNKWTCQGALLWRQRIRT